MIASVHPVVLVTGVSSGIGRAAAALLATSGYRVYGSVRAIKPEAELADVSLVRFDIRDENSIQAAVAMSASDPKRTFQRWEIDGRS
jgi:NAD(P)-dependent dehydrogenase (short-subunit alcohol dehydrogenase family)